MDKVFSGKIVGHLPLSLSRALAVVVCVFSFVGLGAWLLLPLDLFNHFRLQYSACLVLCILILLFDRKLKLATTCTLILALNLSQIIPMYFARVQAQELTGKTIAVLDMNLWLCNDDQQAVLNCIKVSKPDVVTVQELTPRWLAVLQSGLNEYPYRKFVSREDGFGIGTFSKLPLSDATSCVEVAGRCHVLLTTVEIGSRPLTIVNTHTLPPMYLGAAELDMKIVDEIARLRQQGGQNVIVIGDLNSSPWSFIFQHLLQTADLKDTETGYGPQPSWPTSMAPMQIPIDHCLVSSSINTICRRILPSVSSDHYPLYVELSIPN
jgi:endonuclease/exonuclease/phosphatase (EEP) superfamily protein YafD